MIERLCNNRQPAGAWLRLLMVKIFKLKRRMVNIEGVVAKIVKCLPVFGNPDLQEPALTSLANNYLVATTIQSRVI